MAAAIMRRRCCLHAMTPSMPPTPTSDPQAEELLAALARMEATVHAVRSAAGQGNTPELERELQARQRCLRALLATGSDQVVEDVVDAARRVLDAAAPEAPLLVLAMAWQSLASVVRRQAATRPWQSAA